MKLWRVPVNAWWPDLNPEGDTLTFTQFIPDGSNFKIHAAIADIAYKNVRTIPDHGWKPCWLFSDTITFWREIDGLRSERYQCNKGGDPVLTDSKPELASGNDLSA